MRRYQNCWRAGPNVPMQRANQRLMRSSGLVDDENEIALRACLGSIPWHGQPSVHAPAFRRGSRDSRIGGNGARRFWGRRCRLVAVPQAVALRLGRGLGRGARRRLSRGRRRRSLRPSKCPLGRGLRRRSPRQPLRGRIALLVPVRGHGHGVHAARPERRLVLEGRDVAAGRPALGLEHGGLVRDRVRVRVRVRDEVRLTRVRDRVRSTLAQPLTLAAACRMRSCTREPG